MSRRSCGPINQIAFVVDDFAPAIEHWTRTMQVGPFYRFPRIEFAGADYRGQPVTLDYEAAIAFSGDLMIEFIKPNGPSIFREFLDSGQTGVQHLCVFTDDFDAACRDVEARGGIRLQGGHFADGSCLAYYDMGGPPPSILEVAHLKPDVLALFATLKTAAANWDGTTPMLTV